MYETLGRQLVDAVPELTEAYATLGRTWDDEAPGPHIVFGDVLNPYLLALLESPELAAEHAEIVARIFDLLERMARHDDPLVREVVSATVAERLGDEPRTLAIARTFMGDATRRLADDVEAFWATGDTALAAATPKKAAEERPPRPRRRLTS